MNSNNGFFNNYVLPVTGNVSPSAWTDWRDELTGAGLVGADMDGDVLVGFMTVCSIDHPNDFTNMS